MFHHAQLQRLQIKSFQFDLYEFADINFPDLSVTMYTYAPKYWNIWVLSRIRVILISKILQVASYKVPG